MSLGSQSNLSEEIRSVVREMIVDGKLPPGARVNEVHLARKLDVSRTPLREALSGLVSEGALQSIARRGFFVAPLSVEEFTNIYPIRRILDPEALRLGGLPSEKGIRRLETLNARIRNEAKVEKRIRLDDEWHLELLAGCPNAVLLDLIQQFMLRTRRYELAFYRDRKNVERTTADHNRVMAAARTGNLKRTVKALEANLTSGFEPILKWLHSRASVVEGGT